MKFLDANKEEGARLLKSWGLTDAHLERASDRPYIPGVLRTPMFLKDIGVIYGIR
jgi:hypothetical protein